jgi:hypothetical protein
MFICCALLSIILIVQPWIVGLIELTNINLAMVEFDLLVALAGRVEAR